MKKVTKKLRLDQQTLRVLDAAKLTTVAGGGDGVDPNRNNTVCTAAVSGCASGKASCLCAGL